MPADDLRLSLSLDTANAKKELERFNQAITKFKTSKLKLQIDTTDATKAIQALKKELGSIKIAPIKMPAIATPKGNAPATPKIDTSAYKSLNQEISNFSAQGLRMGRTLTMLNGQFGIGSEQSQKFTSAIQSNQVVGKQYASILGKLKTNLDEGKISQDQYNASLNKLLATAQNTTAKLKGQTWARQIQTDLSGVSNMISMLSPQMGSIINTMQMLGGANPFQSFSPAIKQASDDLKAYRQKLAEIYKAPSAKMPDIKTGGGGLKIPNLNGQSMTDFANATKLANTEVVALRASLMSLGAIGVGALAGIVAGMGALFTIGVKSQIEFQKSQNTLATVMSTAIKYADAQGNALDNMANFQVAQGEAKKLASEFDILAAQIAGVERNHLDLIAQFAGGQIAKAVDGDTKAMGKLTAGVASALAPLSLLVSEVQIRQESKGLFDDVISPQSMLAMRIIKEDFAGSKKEFKAARDAAIKAGEGMEFFTGGLGKTGKAYAGVLAKYIAASNMLAKSLDNSLSIMNSAIDIFTRTMGEKMVKPFQGMVDAIGNVFNTADGIMSERTTQIANNIGQATATFAQSFAPLVAPLTELAITTIELFTQLSNVLSPIIGVLSTLLGSAIQVISDMFHGLSMLIAPFQGLIDYMTMAVTSTDAFNASLLMMQGTLLTVAFGINPVIGGVVALSLALNSLSKTRDDIKDIGIKAFEAGSQIKAMAETDDKGKLTEMAQSVAKDFAKLPEEQQKAIKEMGDQWNALPPAAQSAFNKLKVGAELTMQDTQAIWNSGMLGLLDKTRIIGSGILNILSKNANAIAELLTGLLRLIPTWVAATGNAAARTVVAVFRNLSTVIVNFFNFVRANLGSLLTSLAKGDIQGVGKALMGGLQQSFKTGMVSVRAEFVKGMDKVSMGGFTAFAKNAKKLQGELSLDKIVQSGLSKPVATDGTKPNLFDAKDRPDGEEGGKKSKEKGGKDKKEKADNTDSDAIKNKYDLEAIKNKQLQIDAQAKLNELKRQEQVILDGISQQERDLSVDNARIDAMVTMGQMTQEQAINAKAVNEQKAIELSYQKEIRQNEAELAQEKLQYDTEEKQRAIELAAFDSQTEELRRLAKTQSGETQQKTLEEVNKREQERKKLILEQNNARTEGLNKLNNEKLVLDQKNKEAGNKKQSEQIMAQSKSTAEIFNNSIAGTMQSASKGLATDLINSFRNGGEDIGKSIMTAFTNAGNKILDKVINNFVDKIFAGGGGGSFDIGSMFGGGGGTGASSAYSPDTTNNMGLVWNDMTSKWDTASNAMTGFTSQTSGCTDALGGLQGGAGGLMGVFQNLIGGLGGVLKSIGSGIGGLFSGKGGSGFAGIGSSIAGIFKGGAGGGAGIGSMLGGGGGAMGALGPIGAIAAAGFGVFSMFKGMAAKKKQKKEAKRQKDIQDAMSAMDKAFGAIDKVIDKRIEGLNKELKGIDKAISKLDTSSSIINIQTAINKSLEAITKITDTIGSSVTKTISTLVPAVEAGLGGSPKVGGTIKGIIGRLRGNAQAITQVLTEQITVQATGLHEERRKIEEQGKASIDRLKGLGAWEQVTQAEEKLTSQLEKIDKQIESLNEQKEKYSDQIEGFIKKQKELIANFNLDFSALKADEMFGEGAGDIVRDIDKFNTRVRELLMSGFDPDQVAYVIGQENMKLQGRIRESVRARADEFANKVVSLNEELFGVLSEGRVTGATQKTQRDKIKDIQSRLDKVYADQQASANTELGAFGAKLGDANAQIDYFINKMNAMTQSAITDTLAGRTVLDGIDIKVNMSSAITEAVNRAINTNLSMPAYQSGASI